MLGSQNNINNVDQLSSQFAASVIGNIPAKIVSVDWLSIRRETFTSGHNVKPPFLRQYLGFLFQFFFQKLEITLRPLLRPQNPNLKKIADLKAYGNLKAISCAHPSKPPAPQWSKTQVRETIYDLSNEKFLLLL